MLDINLSGLFFLTQHIGRPMVERGRGKIVSIASLLAFQGGIRVISYTASKHGVAGITKALANEWGPRGVQVNAIAPGYMATDNTTALREDADRARSILERIPAGRWGTPQDVAGAAVFLSSRRSRLRQRTRPRRRWGLDGPLTCSAPDITVTCHSGRTT